MWSGRRSPSCHPARPALLGVLSFIRRGLALAAAVLSVFVGAAPARAHQPAEPCADCVPATNAPECEVSLDVPAQAAVGQPVVLSAWSAAPEGVFSWAVCGAGTAPIDQIGPAAFGWTPEVPGIYTVRVRYTATVSGHACSACATATVEVLGDPPCAPELMLLQCPQWIEAGQSAEVFALPSTGGGQVEWFVAGGWDLLGVQRGTGPIRTEAALPVDTAPVATSGLVHLWARYTAPGCLPAYAQCSFVVSPDTDGDGLADLIDPFPGAVDADSDGYGDPCEVALGTDPGDAASVPDPRVDTDDDGLSDVQERCLYSTDAEVFDTDADGLQDLAEVELGLDPLAGDTDANGSPDRAEAAALQADRDQDRLYDEFEEARGWAGDQADMDGDGVSDGWEVRFGTDPRDAASVPDVSLRDSDGDGLSDFEEIETHGTDPVRGDSDADGMPDGWEVQYGLDATDAADAGHDADGDGVDNLEEFFRGIDPIDTDSDNDGVNDGIELLTFSNPLDGDDGGVPIPEDERVLVEIEIRGGCATASMMFNGYRVVTNRADGAHARVGTAVVPVRLNEPFTVSHTLLSVMPRNPPHCACSWNLENTHSITWRAAFFYPVAREITNVAPQDSLISAPADPWWVNGRLSTTVHGAFVHDCTGPRGHPNTTATITASLSNYADTEIGVDPLTHTNNGGALTVLPGDTELITLTPRWLNPLWVRSSDPTVAAFLVDNQHLASEVPWMDLVSWGTGAVFGRRPGSTTIEVRVGSYNGPLIDSIPVHVGGEVIVEFSDLPTFKIPAYTGTPPNPPPGEGPGSPPQPGEPLPVGGGPPGSPGGRRALDREVIAAADLISGRRAPLRFSIRDALGNYKGHKRIALMSRRNRTVIELPDPLRTLGTGPTHPRYAEANTPEILANIPADVPAAHVQDWSFDYDEIIFLYGRTADRYVLGDIIPTDIEPLWDARRMTQHVFTGNQVRFSEPISVAAPLDHEWIGGYSFRVPILNHTHYIALLQSLSYGMTPQYGSPPDQATFNYLHVNGIDLVLPDPVTGEPVPTHLAHPLPLFQAVDGSQPHEDYVLEIFLSNEDLWRARNQQFNPNEQFSIAIEPAPDGSPDVTLRVGAMVTEFALGFLPGWDAVDVVKEGFWKPVVNDEPSAGGYAVAVVSLIGLLADGGYLAGPTGLVTNAASGALKVIVKHMDEFSPGFSAALFRMGGSVVSSARIAVSYLSKVPKPPGFDIWSVPQVRAWGVNAIETVVGTWTRVLHSPLGLSNDHVTRSVALIDTRCARVLTAEATEGIAAYVKLGRNGEAAIDGALVKVGSGLPDEVADTARESVSVALQKTYRDQNELQAVAIARTDDAVAACQATLHPAYRSIVESFVGENHVIKSMEEFEALRYLRAERLPDPQYKTALNSIRQAMGGLTVGSQVRKIMPLDAARRRIEEGDPNLSGFFARSSDVSDATTTTQLVDRLRLDYQAGPFPPGSPHVILETDVTPAIAANAKIPRSPGYADGSPNEFIDHSGYPFTGSGFTASRDGHLVPEFTTGRTAMQAGLDGTRPVTTMRFRFDDGSPYPQTINGQTASDWMLVPHPLDPNRTEWVPIP